jgi:hypothetical protein
MTSAVKIKHKQPVTSNENKHRKYRLKGKVHLITLNMIVADDEEELQLKSAPVRAMLSTQSATNSVELKKLTMSMETMRTSVLQA